ncbi:kinase phosphorylation protein-domain-containing protein [Phellopilus nigrolimitatus]|nr:kinase phosphorylation protein-domain-containing protein [Phellopilus nigrolimitatus]
MFEPIRGGTRGGQAEFKWSDVSADKDREHYLGHSINAPTGRWQKNKDVHWYNRDSDMGEAEKQAEIKRIKEAEEEAMSQALGFAPTKKTIDAGSNGDEAQGSPTGGPSGDAPAPGDDDAEKRRMQKAMRKMEKRAMKEEKKARKEARRKEGRRHDSGSDHDRNESYRERRRSRSRSPRRLSLHERGVQYSNRRSTSPRRARSRSRSPREVRNRDARGPRNVERERESDGHRWDDDMRREHYRNHRLR